MRPGVISLLAGGSLILAALVSAIVRPHAATLPSVLALVGAGALAAGLWLERRAVRRLMGARQARFGPDSDVVDGQRSGESNEPGDRKQAIGSETKLPRRRQAHARSSRALEGSGSFPEGASCFRRTESPGCGAFQAL